MFAHKPFFSGGIRLTSAPGRLADLIRRRRLAAGLTQADLGRMVGRSASAVRNWERGRSLPGEPDVLQALAAALGIGDGEMADVLDGEDLSFDSRELFILDGGPEVAPKPRPVLSPPSLGPSAPTESTAGLREAPRGPVMARQAFGGTTISYIEDPEQRELYRVRAALTGLILVGLFVVLLWSTGELKSALGAVLEPFGLG